MNLNYIDLHFIHYLFFDYNYILGDLEGVDIMCMIDIRVLSPTLYNMIYIYTVLIFLNNLKSSIIYDVNYIYIYIYIGSINITI